jgi:hypothetical protein
MLSSFPERLSRGWYGLGTRVATRRARFAVPFARHTASVLVQS